MKEDNLMAMNDKQPMLEPINQKTKDGLASLYTVFAILAWLGGILLTACAVMALFDIGPFADYFNALLEEGVSIPVIVGMALGTLFSGLFLLTIGKVLRLLKKLSTTTYSIRNLDAVIPKVTQAAPAKEEHKEKEAPKERHVEHGMASQAGQGAVSITFNVQGALNPDGAQAVAAIPAEEGVPALPGKTE